MRINQKTTRKTTQKNKFSLQKRFYRSLLPLILLFCFSLAITPVIAQNQINKPDNGQLIEQASQLYKAGKFSEAIPIWEQAIQSLPQDSLNQALVRSNLALTYQQQGKWELAKSEINQSLKILESAKILGLQWKSDQLKARIDWGHTLTDINSQDQTSSENRLHFSVESRL